MTGRSRVERGAERGRGGGQVRQDIENRLGWVLEACGLDSRSRLRHGRWPIRESL